MAHILGAATGIAVDQLGNGCVRWQIRRFVNSGRDAVLMNGVRIHPGSSTDVIPGLALVSDSQKRTGLVSGRHRKW